MDDYDEWLKRFKMDNQQANISSEQIEQCRVEEGSSMEQLLASLKELQNLVNHWSPGEYTITAEPKQIIPKTIKLD